MGVNKNKVKSKHLYNYNRDVIFFINNLKVLYATKFIYDEDELKYDYIWQKSDPVEYHLINILKLISQIWVKKDTHLLYAFVELLCKSFLSDKEFDYIVKLTWFCAEEHNNYGFNPISFTLEQELNSNVLNFFKTKFIENEEFIKDKIDELS